MDKDEYVVTGHVVRLGRRDRISKPMPLAKAKNYKRILQEEMAATVPEYPQYKWVKNVRIAKV